MDTTTHMQKRNRRFQKPGNSTINLSSYKLTSTKLSLLGKGLHFIPTPEREHQVKILQDILIFDQELKLRNHFYNKEEKEEKKLNHTYMKTQEKS